MHCDWSIVEAKPVTLLLQLYISLWPDIYIKMKQLLQTHEDLWSAMTNLC